MILKWRGTVFGSISLYVCLSVVYGKRWPGNMNDRRRKGRNGNGLREHLDGIQVKFVYDGYRAKVKVTAAK